MYSYCQPPYRLVNSPLPLELPNRILIFSSSSVNATLSHDAHTLASLAKKLGFSFEAFGHTHGNKTERHITLSTKAESPLEPAPISPSDSKAFELMASTARHIFGAKIVTSPTGMYGACLSCWS